MIYLTQTEREAVKSYLGEMLAENEEALAKVQDGLQQLELQRLVLQANASLLSEQIKKVDELPIDPSITAATDNITTDSNMPVAHGSTHIEM